jgi:hypothetical protein
MPQRSAIFRALFLCAACTCTAPVLRGIDLRLTFERADRRRIIVDVAGCFTIKTPAPWHTDAPVKAGTAVFNNEGTRATYVLDIPLEGPQNTIVTFLSSGQATLRISAIRPPSLTFEAYHALQRADLYRFEVYFMEDNQDVAAVSAFTKEMVNGITALVSNATSIDGIQIRGNRPGKNPPLTRLSAPRSTKRKLSSRWKNTLIVAQKETHCCGTS